MGTLLRFMVTGPFPLIKQGSVVCTVEALVKQHLRKVRKVSHGILASGGLGWLEPGQSRGVGYQPGRSAAVDRASLWQLNVFLFRGPYQLADSVWFFSITVMSFSVGVLRTNISDDTSLVTHSSAFSECCPVV